MNDGHGTAFAGAIVKSVSVENLLNQREAVVERISSAITLLHEAQAIADAANLASGVVVDAESFLRSRAGTSRAPALPRKLTRVRSN